MKPNILKYNFSQLQINELREDKDLKDSAFHTCLSLIKSGKMAARQWVRLFL